MKDQNGIYYYPDPADTNTRVYVREGTTGAEFRLWRQNMPEVWEKHGWMPHQVIEAAAAMYRESGEQKANPMLLYDLNVANALIKQEKKAK